MPTKTVLVALVALMAFVAAQPASAAQPHRYTLHGKHKHCRKGYRRVKRAHKTFCIKRAKKKGAALAEKVKLHAHLDPTYTRNPLDPFEVTYAYSASATQEPAAGLAAASAEEPAPLPKGVLSFYSDGILECSVNVGGSSAGDECPVDYQALGVHKVTTLYTAGEESATVTETETIEPLPTSVALSVSYEPLTESETIGAFDWLLGYVRVAGSTTTGSGPFGLACRSEDGPSCLDPSLSLAAVGVEGRQCNASGSRNAEPICFARLAGEAVWLPIEAFEDGSHFLRGVQAPLASGYIGAEARANLAFSPSVHFPQCDPEHTGPWC